MEITPTALDHPTLMRLRWGGTGILGCVLGMGLLGWVPGPRWEYALGILGAAALLNLTLLRVPKATGPVLALDIAVLTAMFVSSGGVANPFTLLYLYPVMLAALVLDPRWSIGLAGLSTAAFAAMYASSTEHHHHMDMSNHLVGMVLAYGLTVPLLAAAVHRFRSAARAAEEATHRARQSAEAAERLSSLAALAGGAAHELATPLSTILLISRELRRGAEGEVLDDLDAIGSEVESCRSILSQLAFEAGPGAGEAFHTVPLSEFVREAVSDERVELDASEESAALPTRLLGQALRRLVGNAFDAAGPEAHVVVRARKSGDSVAFEVEDDGPGMEPTVLERACEPFFTTKPHGKGQGLGLFFVHSLAQQLQGEFTLEAGPQGGTMARLTLPGGV